MHQSQLKDLLDRYLQGMASPEEEQALFHAVEQEEYKGSLELLLDGYFLEAEGTRGVNAESGTAILEAIYQAGERVQPARRVRLWPRFAAAAAIVLVLAGAAWFSLRKETTTPVALAGRHVFKNDVAAGSSKALLTLADGSTIMLDSAANGNLAQQGNTRILKLNEGQLAYQGAQGAAAGWNTITTPRGGQYQVTLPDGTSVWLNAASSIRFPTAFTETQRSVSVTGEVYMEVAPNARQPFIVHANEATVEVLGTSFNINAYEDESHLRATLLSGSVKVWKGNRQVLLQPGQQASIAAGIDVVTADPEQVVAWKNGYFHFDGMDLAMAMRQIARWYNVDITYRGKIPDKQFGGELPRSLSLQQLIKLLRFGDITVEVTGNHITIIGD